MRNPGRPAVIVPTQAVDAEELTAQCAAAAAVGAVDVIEWRIDPLLAKAGAKGAPTTADFPAGSASTGADTRAEDVLRLLPHATAAGLPILLTVRTGFEGGQVEITEDDYAEVVRTLIAGTAGTAATTSTVPVAIDVEIDRAHSRTLVAAAQEAGVPVVASHHNFEQTDSIEELLETFAAMGEAGADVAKVAMMPHTPADVLRLLEATAAADASSSAPVLGISMGALGRTSRIMGADFGSCATFAQIGQASAPGQIDAAVLSEILDRVTG